MPRIEDSKPLAAAGAETEEGRRPTIVSAPAAASPELLDRPLRRTFTAKDKLRILGEVDRAAGWRKHLLVMLPDVQGQPRRPARDFAVHPAVSADGQSLR